MKKLLLSLVALFVLSAGASWAQFGIVAGLTSSSVAIKDFNPGKVNQFHFGVAYKAEIGSYFAVQPEILYQVKGGTFDENGTVKDVANSINFNVGYLEVPVQLQGGVDLGFIRPYAFAEPFVGLAVNAKEVGEAAKNKTLKDYNFNKVEYGLGLGVGLDVWILQVSAKYFWNFGDIEGTDLSSSASRISEGKNFDGFVLSVGVFF